MGRLTQAVRTPSDSERDFYLSGYITETASGLPYFARFNANAGFRPEQMNGYELGYRRLFGKKFYIDLAGFDNHYHNLFDEEIIGEPYLEDNPPPTYLLLLPTVRQRASRLYEGCGGCPRVEPGEFLAPTGIVFVPAHEYRQRSQLFGCGERARHCGTEPTASGGNPV
jgi:hypothetical protein